MKNLKKKLYSLLVNFYMHSCRFFLGIDNKKVVFESFTGKTYSDNPRAISEALHEIMPEAKITWFFNSDKTGVAPDYIVRVTNKLKQKKELATAAAVVNNFQFQMLPKHKKQLFIQTWHGDKGFKTVLHNSPNAPKDRVFFEQIEGNCDYCVAGSVFGETVYRTAFKYMGDFLKVGSPRNDKLMKNNPDEIVDIKKKLGLPLEAKILLFAPTLRQQNHSDGTAQETGSLDIAEILTLLEEKQNTPWLGLLRAHPSIVDIQGQSNDARLINVTSYEDMVDLLLISDLLITDYSSSACDFALTDRPAVLFQSDKKEYLENDRTFCFNMEDSHFHIAETVEQLKDILCGDIFEQAVENNKKILEFFGDYETGHAALSVAEVIKTHLEKLS